MTYQEKLDQSYEKGVQFGLQEGLELGISKTKLEDAKAMYAKGISLDIIKEITGIDPEKLKDKDEHNQPTIVSEPASPYND